jgi:simple sugar transport system ATP-binding protein
VRQQLVRQRSQGKAVLLISSELSEIMDLSDRIIVMYEGRIQGEVGAAEANEQMLGLLMAGARGGSA